jgi:hypothetical protein
MKIPEKFQRLAQEILKKRVEPALKVDGDFGRNSEAAARKWITWSFKGTATRERWLAAVIQGEAMSSGIHIGEYDAWWGPQTQDAAYRLLGPEHIGWRPDEQAKPIISAPRCWTPTDNQMMNKFGNVGSSQVLIDLPFTMRLDWDLSTKVKRASCHRLFAKPLTNALEEIRDSYGLEKISALNIDRFGGILNVRKKRGGSTWSTHAWGVAIDLWPSGNMLAWKKNRAAFAKNEYSAMRTAFEKAGLMSLGTCYDFDWMHWQLNP